MLRRSTKSSVNQPADTKAYFEDQLLSFFGENIQCY
jgi:hypothetical protein